MSEMINRVGRAIDRGAFRKPDGGIYVELTAMAAIEALRDPPDEILMAAGQLYGGKVDAATGLQARRDAWNKMIDAMLKVPA